MKSKIAEAIKMKYSPVALLWSDEKPEGAVEFQKERWGCVMALASSAAKGRIAAASRETTGCMGGMVGLGFSERYSGHPIGIEYFLSTGNPDLCKTEAGRRLAEKNPDMLKGERYIKTPELAKKFADELCTRLIPNRYVIFKPLELVTQEEEPKIVIFMVNPDQISALVFLANYSKETTDNVIAPMGAGCQQFGILAYQQTESDNPKAIIGLTDPSARKVTDRALGRDILSFQVPYKMYRQMEDDVEGSFLQRDTWLDLMKNQ